MFTRTGAGQVSARNGARLTPIAAIISLLVVSLFVYRGSYAAFTDYTDNQGNAWAAGTVTLVNDPDGDGTFGNATTAEFDESGLIPGDSNSGCIDVRFDGSIAAASLTTVALYTANLSDTDGGGDSGDAAKLSDDLDVAVNVYDAGETCATASPTRTEIRSAVPLDQLPTAFASGVDSGWTPASAGEVRAFEFTWTLGADTANDAQGDSADVDFVWEIQTS